MSRKPSVQVFAFVASRGDREAILTELKAIEAKRVEDYEAAQFNMALANDEHLRLFHGWPGDMRRSRALVDRLVCSWADRRIRAKCVKARMAAEVAYNASTQALAKRFSEKGNVE